MDEMRGKVPGIESDPGAQFLRDLHDLLLPMMLAKKMGVAFVVIWDFNMGWEECVGSGPFGSLGGFADSLGMVNAVQARHGEQYWTFAPQGTVIDHVLVSGHLASVGGIRAEGVWQGMQLNNSDHRAVGVVIDVEPWLKYTVRWARLGKPHRRLLPSRIRLTDKKRMWEYQGAVVRRWEEEGWRGRCCTSSKGWQSGGRVAGSGVNWVRT